MKLRSDRDEARFYDTATEADLFNVNGWSRSTPAAMASAGVGEDMLAARVDEGVDYEVRVSDRHAHDRSENGATDQHWVHCAVPGAAQCSVTR